MALVLVYRNIATALACQLYRARENKNKNHHPSSTGTCRDMRSSIGRAFLGVNAALCSAGEKKKQKRKKLNQNPHHT